MDNSHQFSVSVVITTHNRKDEVGDAIRSALDQTIPVEILVMDDGSTDGTEKIIRAEFPFVRLHRSETSMGYIAQRNRAARLATGNIIFSIDDDALFPSPNIIEKTLLMFNHSRVGAVAIPYLEPHKDKIVRQQAPWKEGIFVTESFIGTAHALRKDIFLRLGGYREFLVHQGEEMDFCIRMLEIGYIVRLGTSDPIHHMESPRRDMWRMAFYGRRNDILFAWHNVPTAWLAPHLSATTYRGLQHGLRMRDLTSHLSGLTTGWKLALAGHIERKPVKRAIYRLSRQLKKRGPLRLADVEYRLPPL